MKNTEKIAVFLVLMLMMLGVFSSGCIYSTIDVNRVLWGVSTLPLQADRGEILRINFTSVEPQIKTKGYDWSNSSHGDVIEYEARMTRANTTHTFLTIKILSASNTSFVRGSYDADKPMNEYELNEKKQYLLNSTKEIAQICNLTINWTAVDWMLNWVW